MKVCFIGAGSIGKRHIRNLSMIGEQSGMDLEIHLLKSTDSPLDEDVREKISVIHRDWNGLDESYDAVFITNPTDLHYDTLKRALRYTDCFFIEKPVFGDVNADISVFDVPGKKYYVACPLRYNGILIRAREIIEKEKVIGARAISSTYLPDWRKGVDYRTIYSADKNRGGGVRIDIIHEWDYLISMFGMPERVVSMSGTFSDLEITSEDLAVYIAKYPDLLIELHLDYFGRDPRREFEVFTNGHAYVFDLIHRSMKKDGEVCLTLREDANDMYVREMENFLRICSGETTSRNDIRHAIRVMKTALS